VSSIYTDPATSERYLRVSVPVRDGLGAVTISPEVTADLTATPWQTNAAQVGAPVSAGNGTSIVTYQDSVPVSAAAAGQRFIRLRVQSN
jgi:hypothetical protein